MIQIFLKEVNEFLNSLIAYITIGVFLSIMGLLLWVFPETSVLDYGYASMETMFAVAPYVFIFLIPAITMRSIAEERKNGTLELLHTLPFTNLDIVLGKFFAGFFLVVFSLIPTVVYYFSLNQLGNPPGNLDTSGIIGSYIGLFLLGAAFTSIGIFASSISTNQIVAFVLAAFLSFMLYAGFDSISSINVWADWSTYIAQVGMMAHYDSLSRGLIDFVDIVYFIGIVTGMVLLTQMNLGFKR
jgi:ABC-2 type transport system permease protein